MFSALTGLGLSTAAGLNAYIPLLVVGVLSNITDAVKLPDGYDWLSNWGVLGVLALLLAAEFVLDKVPAVDTVNDVIQTAIRPASGGVVFSATSAAAELDNSTWMAENPWIGWVLGIVMAMSSVAEGASSGDIALLVAAAMVGTFLGIFLCYGVLDPLSNVMKQRVDEERKALESVKVVLVTHVAGKPPLLAIDAGRRLVQLNIKPSFARLEGWIDSLENEGDEDGPITRRPGEAGRTAQRRAGDMRAQQA